MLPALSTETSTHQSQGPEGMKSLVSALLVLHMELSAFINRHFLPTYSRIKAELPILPSSCLTYSSEQDTGTPFGPWWISCPRHPAISTTPLVLKSILQTIKCLQGCKQGNVAKPGAGFLQTTGRAPEFLGILSQWHTSCQVLQPLPTVRLSIVHVRN